MPAIRCDVEDVGTRLVVRVAGELSLATAPQVRMTLLKCLVEHPDAVVVDLTGVVIAEAAAVAVFLTVSRQAALWPDTPLLIAAPDPPTAQLLSSGYSRLAVFGSVAEALAAEPRRRMPAIGDVLLPVSGAARHARGLATEACTRWDLPHLIGPASLVAGELVTNAVVHAQTMAEVRFSLGLRYLVVAVRDGSTAEPQPAPGPATEPGAPRGLLLVSAVAQRWGCLPARDGKVVWATLPRRSVAD